MKSLMGFLLIFSQAVMANAYNPFGENISSITETWMVRDLNERKISFRPGSSGVPYWINSLSSNSKIGHILISFDDKGKFESMEIVLNTIDNANDPYGRYKIVDIDSTLTDLKVIYGRYSAVKVYKNLIENRDYSEYVWYKKDYKITVGLKDKFVEGQVSVRYEAYENKK